MQNRYDDRRRDEGYVDPSEFDLIKVIKILWKRKKTIIFGTGFFTVLSIIIVLLLPRIYSSSAFMNTYWPFKDVKEQKVKLQEETIEDIGYKIKLAKSKNIIKLITNDDHIIDFIHYNKESLALKEYVDSDFGNLIENDFIEPVYAYKIIKRKKDNKDNFIIGFNIKGFGKLPYIAQKNTSIIKQYISCIIINKELYEYVNINLNWEKNKLLSFENKILRLKRELSVDTLKEIEIEKIAKKFPSLNKGNKIIMSNEKNQEIYLSPLQLQSVIKIKIVESKQLIGKLNWKTKISKKKINILKGFQKLFEKNKKSSIDLNLIHQINDLFNKYIEENVNEDETNDIAINNIKNKLSYFKQIKNHVFKFTSLPALPKVPIFPKRKIIVISVFILSVIFFVLFAFFIENWKQRKKTV